MALLAKPGVTWLPGEEGVGDLGIPCAGTYCPILFCTAFQVAQIATALHWIVKALRDSDFGSEEGVPTLGKWVAVPAAGLYPPVLFCVQVSVGWRGEGPDPWGA